MAGTAGLDETMLAILVVAGIAVAIMVFVEVFVIAMMQQQRKSGHLKSVGKKYRFATLKLR
jgi:hypothetical protein